MDEYQIKQGAVKVSSVYDVACSEKIRLVEIDCNTKYPEVVTWGNGEALVFLYFGEGSLHPHDGYEKTTPTEINLGKWEIFASSMARYTVRVALFKP